MVSGPSKCTQAAKDRLWSCPFQFFTLAGSGHRKTYTLGDGSPQPLHSSKGASPCFGKHLTRKLIIEGSKWFRHQSQLPGDSHGPQ